MGLGINLHNNPKLSESINLSELNCNINKLIFVDNLSKKISVLLKCKDQEIIDKFLAYDCLIGRFVSWSEGKGLVEKISNEGYLVVRDTNDKVVFLTDEVHLE